MSKCGGGSPRASCEPGLLGRPSGDRAKGDREGPRRSAEGLLGRDDGGGQLLVVPGQDALPGLQQGDPAAGFQGLGALVDDHHVEVAVGQQLQGPVGRSAWWGSEPRALQGHRLCESSCQGADRPAAPQSSLTLRLTNVQPRITTW